MKNKEYEIRSIQDIADMVTSENLDNFIIDFKGVLMAHIVLKQSFPDKTFRDFLWVDDGKHEITCNIVVKK